MKRNKKKFQLRLRRIIGGWRIMAMGLASSPLRPLDQARTPFTSQYLSDLKMEAED